MSNLRPKHQFSVSTLLGVLRWGTGECTLLGISLSSCVTSMLTLAVTVRPGDRISRCSQCVEGVQFGDFRIRCLLFADCGFVVLLAQSVSPTLDRFAAECEAARMKVSTSKSGGMVLHQKKWRSGVVQVPRSFSRVRGK